MTKQIMIIIGSTACIVGGSVLFNPSSVSAFTTTTTSHTRGNPATTSLSMRLNPFDGRDDEDQPNPFASAVTTAALAVTLTLSSLANPVFADTPASTAQKYDGFAEYAKENQMEQSDMFITL